MKNLKNLGQALTKAEQKSINGGHGRYCQSHNDCPPSAGCCAKEQICLSASMYTLGC